MKLVSGLLPEQLRQERAPTQTAMEESLRGVSQRVYAAPSAHAVEGIQKDWLRNHIETEHFMMGQNYGKHLPMQIRMECDILSQVQRLPGLPNSNLGMETILGRDETIDFEDYLGDPKMSETCTDMRAVMEKRLGLEVPSATSSSGIHATARAEIDPEKLMAR